MIKQVTLRNFKRFQEETFNLSNNVILAGSNNSGKSTLLQAIAVWHLVLQKWLVERGDSKARQRTGVAITRQAFTTIPLREMNLLWLDRSTGLHKDELQGQQKLGTPRPIEISVKASDWQLTFELTYSHRDLIYVKPAKNTLLEPILESVKNLQVVHVPPFSGIGAEETRYDRAYQDLLIGQGKPGDILRNLLLEIQREKSAEWDSLVRDIKDIFGYTLLPPSYNGLPFIVCEYQSYHNAAKLDISSAGSGFLQVLMLLGFFYARPASILLLDEPDAHLHLILQKQMVDKLREIARHRRCQLLIATHAEVLVENTAPEQIISFFDRPHQLVADIEREQLREALKRLTNLDLLLAEQSPGVLYVEGETDFNLLREFAHVLRHPTYAFFNKNPFWHSNHGRNPREARAHFFALKATRPKIKGVLLLDGDNRQLPERELATEGLTILRWQRYEIENYLIHPAVLGRFLQTIDQTLVDKGQSYLQKQLPPAIYEEPLADHDYLTATPASKKLLPQFFEAAGLFVPKNEYYQIARQMMAEEIPHEVKEKLDFMGQAWEMI